jgi:hypothetical protein
MASLMAGASVSGAGIPSGSYIAHLGRLVPATVSAGSTTVAGVDTTGLATGMTVAGTAIPAAATIASVGAGTFTLSQPVGRLQGGAASTTEALIVGADRCFTLGAADGGLANATSSGSGVALSITNPPYVGLPSSDNGYFVDNNQDSKGAVVIELRSTAPHGLITGQLCRFNGDVTVPYTGPVQGSVGFNASWPIAGTVTSGSAVITGIRAPYAAGNAAQGPGIPDGTTIASVDSPTQITLSQNATASGTVGLILGGYNAAGTTTNGSAVVTGITVTYQYQPGEPVVGTGIPTGTTIQSVDSPTQITLSQAATATGTPTLTVTGFTPNNGVGSNAYVFVTGPYTVAMAFWTGNDSTSAPQPNGPQVVNATSEISLTSAMFPNGWTASTTTPQDVADEPYEFSAAMGSALPGMGIWLNLPYGYSDGLVSAIAKKAAANVAANTIVYLEFSNENWNFAPGQSFLPAAATLMSYATSGTVMGHAPAPTGPQVGFHPVSPLLQAHAADVFKSAWTAAGRDSSKVRSVLGSWWADGSGTTTLEQLISAQQWGLNIDHVAVAPYQNLPADIPAAVAFSPAGSPLAGAGSWPLDAINDLVRFEVAYSQTNWARWRHHAQLCRNYGQPYVSPQAGFGAADPSAVIPNGLYYIGYTFADSSGRETTMGLSEQQVRLWLGFPLTVVQPAWPLWAQSMRIYLSQPGGGAGTETFYASIPRSQYGPGNAYPVGSTISFTAAPNAGGASPPATNLAAVNTPAIPTLVCYEGGLQTPIPWSVPFQFDLMHDSVLHPSGRDLTYGWLAACQQGDPTLTGSGAVAACYYQLYSAPSFPFMWYTSLGVAEPPGDGTGNGFATIQGGQPADAHDHDRGGTAAYMQGLLDWSALAVPPRSRTFFPRLGARRTDRVYRRAG